jgi:hypothetical protein
MVIAGGATSSIPAARAAEAGQRFTTDEAAIRPAVKVFDAGGKWGGCLWWLALLS